MELVDTHCHIQSAGSKAGERITRELWAKAPELTPETIIDNAKSAGVTKLLCVGCELEDSKLAVEFVQGRPNCWATVGIHPHEAKAYANNQTKLDEFAALVKRPKVVAIGECGLDYYYGHSPQADQAMVLQYQLELAVRYQLPLILHVRDAFDDFWPIFDKYKGKIRGVLHSFTDDQTNLERALKNGLFIGVNGIATFAKDPAQLAVYKSLPLDRLLLETDAPFLTPTPFRGTINESKQIRTIAEFLAGLRGESLEQLAAATTRNARELFDI